eukprot:scaffold866_cov544-Prasinococcus_capsulatus_cf.AAC.2
MPPKNCEGHAHNHVGPRPLCEGRVTGQPGIAAGCHSYRPRLAMVRRFLPWPGHTPASQSGCQEWR